MKSLAVLSLLLACSPAFAAEGDERVPPEFLGCASIKRNSERLACYDRAVGALRSGGSASQAATPESNFGLLTSVSALPRASPDGSSESKGEVNSIQSTVKALGRAADGSRVITLDNGQKWEQLSSTDILVKIGDAVTISRAALGSFQISVPSGRTAKVKRVG